MSVSKNTIDAMLDDACRSLATLFSENVELRRVQATMLEALKLSRGGCGSAIGLMNNDHLHGTEGWSRLLAAAEDDARRGHAAANAAISEAGAQR